MTFMDEGIYVEYLEFSEGENDSIDIFFNNGDTVQLRFDGIYKGHYFVPFHAILEALEKEMNMASVIKS